MIIIPGYTSDDKVPGTVAQNVFGTGAQSIGAGALVCVLFGNKATGGTAPLNERTPVTTPEEADAAFGAREELGRMAVAALDIPGVTLYGVPVLEAVGAAAAKYTVAFGGSWSTSGEIGIQLDEEIISIAVAASHTPTTFGDAFADAVNQASGGRLFASAVNTTGSVVLTVASKGVRGNQHIAFLNSALKPAGMTATVTRNSAVVQSGGGPVLAVGGEQGTATNTVYVLTITTGGANGTAEFSLTANGVNIATGETVPTTPFTYDVPSTSLQLTFANDTWVLNETYTWDSNGALGNAGVYFFQGTGTDNIQDALDGVDAVTNDYIAPAHNDAVNVGRVETAVNAKAAFDVARLENYTVALNGSQSAAIAIGQTTMNDPLGECIWDQWGVEHPSCTAARAAALYSTLEGVQPNSKYEYYPLPGAPPHYRDADSPNRTTQKAALNNSLTPLVTTNGVKQIVRAIMSRSLNGATPDYRNFDRADTIVPIRVRKELVVLGNQMAEENPFMGPDVGEGLPPEGTMTPRLWNGAVEAKLREWSTPAFNWVTDVDNNLPVSSWDNTSKRIMGSVPTVVKAKSYQRGVVVRQRAV